MLRGKIISVEYLGMSDWKLTIDGKIKRFTTYQRLESYLIWVHGKVRDKDKKKLLKKDMNCLLEKGF